MRILVVDDCPDMRSLLSSLLHLAGWSDVVAVPSARDALVFLRTAPTTSGGHGADLLLLDVVMPGMDGLSLLKHLKRDEHLQDIPVIILTARFDAGQIEEAFQCGALDYVTKPFDRIELGARVRSALRLKQQMDLRRAREKALVETTSRLEKANAELRLLSKYDGLTGLPNRRAFDEALDREWRRGLRGSSPLTLLLLDIDDFKAFNDRHGHLPGDTALRKVAEAIAGQARRPADVAARFGGEEFALLLPDTPASGGLIIAKAVREAVAELAIPHGRSRVRDHVTVSVGVATAIPRQGKRPQDLVHLADVHLYQAKRLGRDRVEQGPVEVGA